MAKSTLEVLGFAAAILGIIGLFGYALSSGSFSWPLLILTLIGIGTVYLSSKIKE